MQQLKRKHSFPQSREIQNAGGVFRVKQQVLEILCFETEIRPVAHLLHPASQLLAGCNALPLRKIVHIRFASGAQKHGIIEIPAFSAVENGGKFHCIQRGV